MEPREWKMPADAVTVVAVGGGGGGGTGARERPLGQQSVASLGLGVAGRLAGVVLMALGVWKAIEFIA